MGATKFQHPEVADAEIYYLGDYIPWSWHKRLGGDGTNWPQHSIDVLELKKNKSASLNSFTSLLEKTIRTGRFDAVSAVPSHDPATGVGTGVRLLAKQVASRIGADDGRHFLRRTTLINKLADGGSRAIQVHLDSIVADHLEEFRGRRILLLDDVLTSGNSLVACRKLLLGDGALDVVCVALGKTKH